MSASETGACCTSRPLTDCASAANGRADLPVLKGCPKSSLTLRVGPSGAESSRGKMRRHLNFHANTELHKRATAKPCDSAYCPWRKSTLHLGVNSGSLDAQAGTLTIGKRPSPHCAEPISLGTLPCLMSGCGRRWFSSTTLTRVQKAAILMLAGFATEVRYWWPRGAVILAFHRCVTNWSVLLLSDDIVRGAAIVTITSATERWAHEGFKWLAGLMQVGCPDEDTASWKVRLRSSADIFSYWWRGVSRY